jgi:hypothetical protein
MSILDYWSRQKKKEKNSRPWITHKLLMEIENKYNLISLEKG